MRRSFLVLAAVLAAVPLVLTAPAEAAPSASGDHCIIHVTGQKPTGELTTSSPRCYATQAIAMRAEGVGASGPNASLAAASSFILGTHCDGYNGGAPCTSTVGTGCTGGWLNVSATWNNRISFTQSGCPTIIHFDGFNLTGTDYPVGLGNTNLTGFNNRTSSIQYT